MNYEQVDIPDSTTWDPVIKEVIDAPVGKGILVPLNDRSLAAVRASLLALARRRGFTLHTRSVPQGLIVWKDQSK